MSWRSKTFMVFLALLCLLAPLVSTIELTEPANVGRALRLSHSSQGGGRRELLPSMISRGGEVWPPNTSFPNLKSQELPKPLKPVELKPLSPGPGDWVVTGEEIHEDETIILTGNLTVESGGNLTLINCTLLMNCSYDGEWQIRVCSGGVMNVLEGSNITAYNPEYEFPFCVYGQLNMRDSFLSECGYSWDYPGLYIQTYKGVIIYNTTITNCYFGVYCDECSSTTIANCTISDNAYFGVYCYDCFSITITSCIIGSNAYDGVFCQHCSSITIANCTISNNGVDGVDCSEPCFYITIAECIISGNAHDGVYCCGCSHTTIANCTISGNEYCGVDCGCCFNITIVDNTFVQDGVVVGGNSLFNYVSHTIENNTVNGKPLYYVVNTTSYIVPPDAGQVIIVNSSDITLDGLNLSYTDVGLEIAYSNNIEIHNCTMNNNTFGMNCVWCSSITITSSTMSDNTLVGVYCYECSNIMITDCMMSNNTYFGVYCRYELAIMPCSNITITNCIISNNTYAGVCYYACSNITITACAISDNGYGVYCWQCSGAIEVHYCNIYSNDEHGLYNRDSETINATYCWWGSPDGPEYKEEGDPHDPEEVYGDVIYEPWLTEPWVGDVEPPSVEIVKPEDGSYLAGAITIEAEASDDVAVDRVEFYINGTLAYTDYEAPYEYEWNTTEWSDGTYIIRAVAYDTSDKSSWDAITVIVDNTPPEGGIIKPEDGSYLAGLAYINITGGDKNLHEIRLYINNTLAATWYENGTYTYGWNTTEWPDGVYELLLQVEDLAGNIAVIEVEVMVDNTKPTIEFVRHTPEEPAEGEEVEVEARASDAISGIESAVLWYRVDGGSWTSTKMSLSGDTWTAIIPGQRAGARIEYYVEFYDKAGNVARSNIKSYTVSPPRGPGFFGLEAWQLAVLVGGIAIAGVAIALVLRKVR